MTHILRVLFTGNVMVSLSVSACQAHEYESEVQYTIYGIFLQI
jgi:hypothetical protein